MSATFFDDTESVEDKMTLEGSTLDAELYNADDQLLAQLGYRPELKREFSYLTVFGQSFGSMGLAPAIAESVGFSLGSAGVVGMVWTYLIGCLMLIPVSLSLGELGSSMPTSGGLYYVLIALIVGSSPHTSKSKSVYVLVGVRKVFSSLEVLSDIYSGYINTLGYISVYASTIYAATLILGAACSIATDGSFVSSKYYNYLIFFFTVVITFFMTCVPTALLNRLNLWYIYLQAGMLVLLVIVLAAATPPSQANNASFVFIDLENTGNWTNKGWGFMMSFLTPVWVVSGFESAATIAEEASNAAKAVPFAMVSSLVAAAFTGWAVVLTIAFCMGDNVIAIVTSPLGQPVAQILLNRLGKPGSFVMLILLWICSLCNCSILMVAASRETFAFARDNGLPGSGFIRVLSKGSVPARALGFVAIGALAEALLMLINNIAINSIFNLAILGLYFAYCMPLILKLIYKDFTPGVWYMGDTWSYISAVYSVVWMVFIMILLLFPSYEHPNLQQMNYAIMVIGTVLIFCVGYYWMPVIGGKTFFTGPVRTIDELSSSDQHNLVTQNYQMDDGQPMFKRAN